MNKNAGDGSGNDGKNSNSHGGKGGGSNAGGGAGAGGPHDPTGLLDAASLFGETSSLLSNHNFLLIFIFLQLTGAVILLGQLLLLPQIRSSTRSSMPPQPPAWVCCRMQPAPLPTIGTLWPQQRRRRPGRIITRTRWRWPPPRPPVWQVCIQQVSKMSA